MSNEPYPAPSVILPNELGKIIDLKNFRPNPIVLFFYPRDNTSGCTREAKDFTQNLKLFNEAKISVFGVSKDSIERHLKFKKKYKLTFDLLSDEKKEVIKKYGVWGKKSFLGKEFMGIVRTTFLINSKVKIHKNWNNGRVKDHAKEVLKTLENIEKK